MDIKKLRGEIQQCLTNIISELQKEDCSNSQLATYCSRLEDSSHWLIDTYETFKIPDGYEVCVERDGSIDIFLTIESKSFTKKLWLRNTNIRSDHGVLFYAYKDE
jgi:hypothetical protein